VEGFGCVAVACVGCSIGLESAFAFCLDIVESNKQ
jgi:hypothetical protein